MANVTSERHFDWFGDFLRFRMGMIFLVGDGPKNAEGAIQFSGPSGARVEKFYLPPAGVKLWDDLAGMVVNPSPTEATYHIPQGVGHAPYGELVLNRRPQCMIALAREGEKKRFGFDRDNYFIFLRINREQDGGFKPLYIEVQKDFEYTYFRLTIKWVGDVITLAIKAVPIGEVPVHLYGSDPVVA
jgi:hypothetical protein